MSLLGVPNFGVEVAKYLEREQHRRTAVSEDSSKWRMNAYYFGFTPTGIPAIDRILSAVACAGKGCHHTEDWGEFGGGYDHLRGENYVEMIQNAADDAASLFKPLPPPPEVK